MCACPKCQREGLITSEKDRDALPFIQCHFCGYVLYKHRLMESHGETQPVVSPEERRVNMTKEVIESVQNASVEFTLEALVEATGFSRTQVRLVLNRLIQNNVIIKKPGDMAYQKAA